MSKNVGRVMECGFVGNKSEKDLAMDLRMKELISDGGKRVGMGGKKPNPNFTREQLSTKDARYADAIYAAVLRIRDLMVNSKWDNQELSETSKVRLEYAWKLVNRHYSPSKMKIDMDVEAKMGLSPEMSALLVAMDRSRKILESKSKRDCLESPSTSSECSAHQGLTDGSKMSYEPLKVETGELRSLQPMELEKLCSSPV